MRKPRTLTWKSVRPTYSSSPSARHFTRSPLRYIRAPASPENGSGTYCAAVSSARPRYPRDTPAPPTYNSPGTPTGTGAAFASSRYTRALPTGRPMLTGSPGRTRATVVFTVASVGP